MTKKTTDAAPVNRRKATAPRRASSSDPVSTTNDTQAGETSGPTADEIAQAAYLRYLSRGGGDGQHFEDWLEAERELKGRKNGG